MEKLVYVEGFTDIIFVKALGITQKRIKQAKSKGNVANRMHKSIQVIGLVDEDPNKANPIYFRQQFRCLEKKHHIELHWDKKKDNYLIILCPRLEEWLETILKGSSINLDQYFTSKNRKTKITGRYLHTIIHRHLQNLAKLIKDLIAQKNPAILYLQHLLNTL